MGGLSKKPKAQQQSPVLMPDTLMLDKAKRRRQAQLMTNTGLGTIMSDALGGR